MYSAILAQNGWADPDPTVTEDNGNFSANLADFNLDCWMDFAATAQKIMPIRKESSTENPPNAFNFCQLHKEQN